MKIGQIEVIDKRTIRFCTENGVFRTSRFCPHEGADLSKGYVENDALRCPWHNIPIDENGNIPCKSIKNLKVTKE